MPARQDRTGWLIVRRVRQHLSGKTPPTPASSSGSSNRSKYTRKRTALHLLLCGFRPKSAASSRSSPVSSACEQAGDPSRAGPLDIERIFERALGAGASSRPAKVESSTPTTKSDKSERISVTISADLHEASSEVSQVRIVVEQNQRARHEPPGEPDACEDLLKSVPLVEAKVWSAQAAAGCAEPPTRALPPNSLPFDKRRQPSSADSRRIGAQRKAWQLNELLDQYGRRRQAAARLASAAGPPRWHLDTQARSRDSPSRVGHSSWRSNSSQLELEQLPEQVDKRFYLEEHWTKLVSLDCCTTSQESSSELESSLATNEYLRPQRNLKVQQDAIWELLSTELAYLKRIRVIIDVFLSALSYVQHHSLLCEVEPVRLASNVRDVYEANRTLWLSYLLPMLKKARANRKPLDPSELKEAFVKIRTIFEPYYRYCLEHRSCLSYVKELKRSNELFKLYVTWCESQTECERLRLTDLLAKPMQRLTRYSLLLRAIAKRTDDRDQSGCLEQMMTQMSKFVLTVNFELRKKDELERLLLYQTRNDSSDLCLDNGTGPGADTLVPEQSQPLAYLEVPRQRELCSAGLTSTSDRWRGSAQQLSSNADPASNERPTNNGALTGTLVNRLRRLFNLDTGVGTFSSTSASVSLSSASYEEPAVSTGSNAPPPRRLARSMEASWTTLDGLQAMDLLYANEHTVATGTLGAPSAGGYLGFHEKLALHNRRLEEEAAARRRLQLRRRAGSDRTTPTSPSLMRRSADRLSVADTCARPRHSSSSSVSFRALNLTRSLTGDLLDSFIHRVASTRRLSSSSGSTLARSLRCKDAPSKN